MLLLKYLCKCLLFCLSEFNLFLIFCTYTNINTSYVLTQLSHPAGAILSLFQYHFGIYVVELVPEIVL